MLLSASASDGPLVLQDGKQNRVADVAGPGDPVGSEHAFAHGTELLHRCLAPLVAAGDAELDAADAAAERSLQHHVLHATVQTGAAQMRAIVCAADLKHL